MIEVRGLNGVLVSFDKVSLPIVFHHLGSKVLFALKHKGKKIIKISIINSKMSKPLFVITLPHNKINTA